MNVPIKATENHLGITVSWDDFIRQLSTEQARMIVEKAGVKLHQGGVVAQWVESSDPAVLHEDTTDFPTHLVHDFGDALCGAKIVRTDQSRLTAFREKVTCKNCIEAMREGERIRSLIQDHAENALEKVEKRREEILAFKENFLNAPLPQSDAKTEPVSFLGLDATTPAEACPVCGDPLRSSAIYGCVAGKCSKK